MFDFDEIIDRRGTHCSEVGHDAALYGVVRRRRPRHVGRRHGLPPAARGRRRRRGRARPWRLRLLRRRPRHKAAICGWMARRHGWEVDPADVFTTHGIVAGLAHLPAGLHRARRRRDPLHPRLPRLPPHHPPPTAARSSQSPLVRAPTAATPWTSSALAAALTGRERMLVLCSPHNPGGRVWSREELQRPRRLLPRPRPPAGRRRDPPRPRPPRQPPRPDAARRPRGRSTGW